MYSMGDDTDTEYKKTNSYTPRFGTSTFVNTIYSQSQPLQLPTSEPISSFQHTSPCCEATSGLGTRQLLSAQVREYYNKYSRGSNLDQYFSLPATRFEGYAYQWRSQTSNASAPGEQFSIARNEEKSKEILRVRRKWDRPMNITGQSSSVGTDSQILHHRLTTTDIQSSSPEEHKCFGVLESQECPKTKNNSPASSVTSNRPLEWDNGADVGYDNFSSDIISRDDCLSLLRLDPEGRTCPNMDTVNASNVRGKGTGQTIKIHSSNLLRSSKPDAHSTQAIDDETNDFGDDIEVTPIIKSHLSGIIAGRIVADDDNSLNTICTTKNILNEMFSNNCPETLKSSSSINSINNNISTKEQVENIDFGKSLKKSASMNVLTMPLSIVPLTMRCQSEFNLYTLNNIKEGENRPTNFYSTSSITTIVTKPPLTCDKDIQTNFIMDIQSKAIQVSTSTSIESNDNPNCVSNKTNKNNSNNINSNNEELINYDKIERQELNKLEEKKNVSLKSVSNLEHKKIPNMLSNSNLESERNLQDVFQRHKDNTQSQSEYETDGGGRASNSFEYFPGEVYEQASKKQDNGEGTTSRGSSSMETRISHSTMPNTSSSFDEKLWVDSDNLLRDLERSLHVLKSLVDANKCDKQVKKRLIHHVIKRLVNAKYTDDKIEHDLADNIPWNPDDTRTKVYRSEIIQALANEQKQPQQNSSENTDEDEREVEDADEWKVTRIRSSSCGKRMETNRERRKIIDLVMSMENSDIFEERNTDRSDAMQDGRKARMGLRNDDKHGHHHHHHHHHHHQRHQHQQQHHSKNIVIDMDKSESSECFLPQSSGLNYQEMKTIANKPTITTTTTAKSQTSSTTPNTTSSRDTSSRDIDDKLQEQRNEKIDWRLPTTISERRFGYNRCTSRLGTASKLIDYVEMEKKNQLIWINSEINHLSNLKKLLEEPKKYENIGDEKIISHKATVNSDKRSSNCSSFKSCTISKQWSSHGNIVERCEKPCNNNILAKPSTKRNNCTQTSVINANDKVSKYNTTDINLVADNAAHDTSNICIQTYSPTAESSGGNSPQSLRYYRQRAKRPNMCRCQRPSSISPRRCHDKLLEDRHSIVSHSSINSKKDAKNLLNDQCKSEFNDTTVEEGKVYTVNRQRRGCCCGNSNELPTLRKKNTFRSSNDPAKSYRFDEQKDKNICNNDKRIHKPQEGMNCRVCGTIRTNDEQCQCKQTYMKPIAYELSFVEAKKPIIMEMKKARTHPSTETVILAKHESCKTLNCSCSNSQPQLKDYLTKNKPEFVDNVEIRKRYMTEITQLRQLKKEKRKQLLAMAAPNSLIMTQKTIKHTARSPRKVSDDEMKMRLRMRYLRLTEVRNKRRQREKEEQTRRNHLMAKIFCKKLQQKVLEGHVDVSQSVSVISNL